jgi:hypothetical protein
MKKILSLLAMLIVVLSVSAQNPFFEVVNYRGAFAPAPATPWTDGWTNWDPNNTTYGAPTVTVNTAITTNTTWTSNNVYLIQGLIYVKNGATLTIQPGTVIRGDATIANSSLVITKGSKINAVGTSSNPIVFTSSKDAGTRTPGDWGGVIILGKGTLNRPGGVANIEGISTSADTEYGGGASPDDNDNSGNLKYVRIEYGGYIFATDQEINGLTLGAVGRNTVVDFVQCSFINDDAFEWFGGTVNSSHLVAYRCLDDNWDTDFGYSGSVQFALGVRDANISDQSAGSTSEGFESDNDGAGSSNTPQTTCVFSNVTDISGFRGTVTNPYASTFKFRRGARLRRNSGIKLLNSILTDAPFGVMIDGAACRANLKTGVTVFKNNIVAGCIQAVDPATAGYATVKDSLFSASIFKNDSLASTSGLIVNPYDFLNPDYRPASGSLALSNVTFNDAAFTGRIIVVSAASSIREVTYRGAFAPAPAVMWTEGWTNWDPNNTAYPTPNVTVTGNINTNTTWTAGNTYLISGLVYVNAGATLTIEPGVVVRGDATVANSSLIITKGAKLNAIGTVDQPIVFTSSKDSAARNTGDWGGLIILGRASLNRPGGTANIEGITATTQTEFGGGASPNDNDNSGTIKYVRIEFGGYVFATDQEINGFTLGAVGRGTVIDYVQCSFINDDAFEWFGGTVNCAHLVAYRSLDDNFDTDFGFSGSVQFALGVRDPLISDQSAGSTSEGFESDNDAAGSSNLPQTRALFTNVTEIGPFRGTVLTSWPSTFKFRRAARIRRNTGIRIFNSIFTDYPTGVFMDGTAVRANLQSGATRFKNNLIAGCLLATESGTATAVRDSIFGSGTGLFKNDSLSSTSGVLITPYNYTAPDYRPTSASLALTGAAFTDAAFTGLIVPCDDVNAPGTISGNSNLFNCVLSGQVYSIPAISNATNYFWTVPAGCTITAGQGTRTITVTFATTYTTGTITVVGKNDCGNTSVAASRLVTKTTLGASGVITAPTGFTTNVCAVVGVDTTLTYTTTAVTGAANYVWTNPANTQIVSGQGTNTIRLKFLAGYNFVIGDSLKFRATSGCANTLTKSLAIKTTLPTLPASITAASVSNACGNRIIRYLAPALPAGATGYNWQLPTGSSLATSAVLDSGVLSGPGARIIRLKYTSNAAAGANDSIRVRYTANCGVTAYKGLKLAITELKVPTAPSRITATLVANNCGARVYRYAAPALPIATTTSGAATGYVWTLASGAVGATGTLDSGTLNSQVIRVIYTSNAAAVAGDSIRVAYTSDCGNSASKGLRLTNTALNAPAAPASVTINALGAIDCAQPRYRYIAPALPAATSTAGAATGYAWTFVGSYVQGTDYVIDSGSLTSQKVVLKFLTGRAKVAGDSAKCRYASACGFGAFKSLTLSNTAVGNAAPLKPATITIAIVDTTICGGRKYRYTAPTLPAGTSVYAAASGYVWTLPTSNIGAVLDSGTLNSKVIVVRYTSNAAAAATDSMYLQYTSACGLSPLKGQKLTNLLKANCLVNGTPVISRTINVTNDGMKAQVYPNPNNGNFTVRVETGITAKTNASIQVLDMNGRLVSQLNTVNNNGLVVANINNSNLNSGIYIVKYTVGNVTNTIKMVVQK